MPLLPPSRPAPAALRLVGPPARRWPSLLLVAVLVAAGCGKRGAPLPPLPRVPAAVSEWSALRSDETVALTLVVPGTNVSGDAPGDIAGIELYAVTADLAPELVAGRVPPGMTLVASARVRRPLPPVPAGVPADLPPVPREPGLDQGERTTFREQLTPELRVAQPAALPAPAPSAPTISDAPALSLPLVMAEVRQVKRHYVAVAVSRRGTRSAWSAVRSVPVGPVSGAPSPPALTYDAAAVTLAWTAARDARSGPAPATADTLESRPFGPVGVATRYVVYATAPDGAAPTKLTEQPVAALTYAAAGIEFGRERCFVVRGVDTLDGVDVEGPASPVACITPADTFPPPAPSALEAVGGAGVVSLIWEGVDAPDLAGYLVFRGAAGGEPTEQLTPEPIRASSFEDRAVVAGTRYVYVVVAVDSATPANRSGPSNRAEETARR
ncbi:MAG: hypothetical protein JNL48_06675 [Acidobacteria bacterium]|nr:hypothetical protein [Acidobacteriota bacterium]